MKFYGDSHMVGGMGDYLWAGLRAQNPGMFIFDFGDNLAGYKNWDPKNCYWITPPLGERGKGRYKQGAYSKNDMRLALMVEWVKTALGSDCKVIDSREITKLSELTFGDGFHQDAAGGTIWGKAVLQVIVADQARVNGPSAAAPAASPVAIPGVDRGG